MPFKPSPRALVCTIVMCVSGVLICSGTVGFGFGLFYMQRQVSQIVLSSQAREDAHRLELDKAKLEVAAEWQKKLDNATRDDAKQQADIDKLTVQNETLIKSLDRLSKLSELRLVAANKIQSKLDTVADKVEQVSDATPGTKKPTSDINRKIQDANRSLK